MLTVYVKCKSCRKEFVSPIQINLHPSNVIDGNSFPCPSCRRMNVYNTADYYNAETHKGFWTKLQEMGMTDEEGRALPWSKPLKDIAQEMTDRGLTTDSTRVAIALDTFGQTTFDFPWSMEVKGNVAHFKPREVMQPS